MKITWYKCCYCCSCWVCFQTCRKVSVGCWCCLLINCWQIVAWKGNSSSSWIPLVVACFQKELLSIKRSKPSFQNRPWNQNQSSFGKLRIWPWKKLEEQTGARNLCIGHLCKSLISFPFSFFLSLTSSWKTWILVCLHRSRPRAFFITAFDLVIIVSRVVFGVLVPLLSELKWCDQ